MQSHMAHKFHKRQETAAEAEAASDSSETRRPLKHGATVHSLRRMPISAPVAASGMSARAAKARCENEGLGVDGASCASTSSALVRAANSSNNKHH